MTGTVIKNAGSWYVVRTDDDQFFSCQVKGNFRLRGIRSTNPVAVGDRVEFNENRLISEVLDRRNYIIRRASNLSKQSHILAANIDQVLLIATVAHPETSTTFIDRFLATAEAYNVPVILLFNKTDLYDEAEQEKMQLLTTLYGSIGYESLPCSALNGTGIDPLTDLLRNRTTLVSGNSGVGKTTLLNALIPGLDARTQEISATHDTGQHTTTFSEMLPLPFGGQVIDTPGIKGFGTFDFRREEVSHYFREIFQTSEGCRFGNCTHTHEPHCAVLQAVKEGRIALSRYTSYLNMLEDEDADRYRQAY